MNGGPHILGAMRTAPLVALALLAACTVETSQSGRPPGQPTAADSLARVEEESVARVRVTAALRVYYRDFSRRDWPAFRESFWPGAIITTRWTPPGASAPVLETVTVEEFVRRAPQGPDRLAVFSESPVHEHIRSYGDLATAWVIYRARFGETVAQVDTLHGVDAFQFMRHDGQWKIMSLAFTAEQPGRPLVARDSAARP